MRITPDFAFLADEVKSNFGEASIIFSALIVVGLIAIFIVSSQAVGNAMRCRRSSSRSTKSI